MLSQVAPNEDVVFFRPQHFVARENESPAAVLHLLEGWACRFRMLADGRRQITALYLPGECCDPSWILGRLPTQPVIALTIVRAVQLPCRLPVGPQGENEHKLLRSLADSCERQASWQVSLGRKTALERIAHLLLELFERMRGAGLAYGQQCALPLTQMDIADVTGLTPVHVNRTLQSLRSKGLLDLQSKWLRILDLGGLRRAAALAPDEMLI
ncbi:Crp/Fnr family transcriptional regulator [Sphingobium sp.]|uniref:Crp/Fnr family transcriptional regulator n=1 Tax=Sphingobium sp. TaxID=1912891 RepID=UPI002BC1F6B3|nr:helix-turn-helix domain-containing protein [Sphingobium sp.]HUD95297.1 helix-turn-helix domain-containing protein [Sphingobium sp.]